VVHSLVETSDGGYALARAHQKQTSFSVTGENGTMGFCEIAIPEELVGDGFPVYLDGRELVEYVDYTRAYNGTHTIFDIKYSHSTRMIEITGTNVIPEFPSWIILPLFVTTTLSVILYRNRLRRKVCSYL
jgi:hypothetical protein